jgi:hypothetical protein
MVYPTTANKSLETPNHGTAVDVWDQPLNSDFNIIDKSFGGTISFNATTGSQTLTSGISDTYSYIPLIIQVGGSISANVVYTIPSGIGGQWVVLNNTTDGTGGPWTVSFVNAYSGTGVEIPRGYSSIINSDGITVRFSDSRVPSAAGSDRQIQFNSGGYFGAASAFVYDSSGNLGVGTASPNYKISVAASGATNKIEIQNTSNAASTSKTSALQFSGTSTSGTLKEAGDIYVAPVDNDYNDSNMLFYTRTSNVLSENMRVNSSGVSSSAVSDSIGNVRTVPINSQTSAYVLTATDSGKFISITTGGVTINSGTFSAGQSVTVYNDSSSNQTITQGTSVTMYWVGTSTTGNRTLAQRGLCTIFCVASNTYVITGGGLA